MTAQFPIELVCMILNNLTISEKYTADILGVVPPEFGLRYVDDYEFLMDCIRNEYEGLFNWYFNEKFVGDVVSRTRCGTIITGTELTLCESVSRNTLLHVVGTINEALRNGLTHKCKRPGWPCAINIILLSIFNHAFEYDDKQLIDICVNNRWLINSKIHNCALQHIMNHNREDLIVTHLDIRETALHALGYEHYEVLRICLKTDPTIADGVMTRYLSNNCNTICRMSDTGYIGGTLLTRAGATNFTKYRAITDNLQVRSYVSKLESIHRDESGSFITNCLSIIGGTLLAVSYAFQ